MVPALIPGSPCLTLHPEPYMTYTIIMPIAIPLPIVKAGADIAQVCMVMGV